MELDDLKRQLITIIEPSHSLFLLPKNYLNVIMALLIEKDPISQDRLIKLTDFSRSAISQILSQLKPFLSIPMKISRMEGHRKKGYFLDEEQDKIFDRLYNKFLDTFQVPLDHLESLLKELQTLCKTHESYLKFYNFANILFQSCTISKKIANDIKENPKYLSDEFDKKKFHQTISEILSQKSKEISFNLQDIPVMTKEMKSRYNALKTQFYSTITDIFSIKSEQDRNYSHIFLEVLVENRPITQDEIIETTQLNRSIVSSALKLMVAGGSVQLIKTKDRKKYYGCNGSGSTLMVEKIIGISGLFQMIEGQISEIRSKSDEIETSPEEKPKIIRFKIFLDEIFQSFSSTEENIMSFMLILNDRLKKFEKSNKSA